MDIELSQRSTFEDAARFVAESSLGRGGMGEVVLLRDRDLRREVAMKVLHAPGEVEEARVLFIGESTLRKAKKKLGVESVKTDVAGESKWFWELSDAG